MLCSYPLSLEGISTIIYIDSKVHLISFWINIYQNIRSLSRKSGLIFKTSEARIVRFAIIQTPQEFSESSHSSWEEYKFQ